SVKGNQAVVRDARVARLVDLAYTSDTIEIKQNGAVILTLTRSGNKELYAVFVNAAPNALHDALNNGTMPIEMADHHFEAYYNRCSTASDKRPIPRPASTVCSVVDTSPAWTTGTPFPPPPVFSRTKTITTAEVFLIGSVDCGPD